VALTRTARLFGNLDSLSEPQKSITPEYMEKFGQNYGLILYRHTLHGNYSGKIYIDGLHDRAWIFIDGEYKRQLWRNNRGEGVSLNTIRDGAVIDVLVEGMGRINYGPQMTSDRKGAAQIRIGNQLLYHWNIFPLPLEKLDKVSFCETAGVEKQAPVFYQGAFRAESKADTFVKLRGFTKGYVWVNGFHLGRYWSVGPQQTLYLPEPLLKDENTVTVLELEKLPKSAFIELTSKPDLRGKKWLGKK
jgi:beta-galactosidase